MFIAQAPIGSSHSLGVPPVCINRELPSISSVPTLAGVMCEIGRRELLTIPSFAAFTIKLSDEVSETLIRTSDISFGASDALFVANLRLDECVDLCIHVGKPRVSVSKPCVS